jgi:alkylation response protein AidB-like acyl-CoA dehydrogenase
MLALVRTGTAASRQQGITMLVVDVRTPGIEVRPLKDMAGETRFSEVFFTDVRIPVQNVVGRENEGWTLARAALGIERSTNYTSRDMGYRRVVNELIRLTAEQGKSGDPLIRQELAHLETAVRLLHLNSLRILSAVLGGDEPGPESSVSRLMHTQFEQRLHEFAISMLGANGMLAANDPLAVQNGRWAWGFLRTRASTIGAGTAEVQRNTIAERILGLPGEPAVPGPNPAVS